MRTNKRRSWLKWAATVAALVGGLLVGWLLIGWWLWPVQWTSALPLDLSPDGREQYLDVVAESYALNKDAALAQERLASFPAAEQLALLTDVQSRVARRLEQTENILILGQDQRPGWEAWRTDSIMVVAIDREHEQVGIVSIPRDLWVNIPDYGQQRINAVDYIGSKMKYPGGGPALAQRVISDTLGIPTQHYVRIHMSGLVRLVDALGGVTVHLDCPLYERTPNDKYPSGYEDFVLPAGDVTLNGDAARKFATYRYVTSDFGRTRRQQQLIWAIRNRALQGDVLGRIPELWSAMSDLYTTDLNLLDVAKLAQFGAQLRPERVHGLVFSTNSLKEFVTDAGEWVLAVKDEAAVNAEKEQLFLRKPLDQLGKKKAGEECPAPPQ